MTKHSLSLSLIHAHTNTHSTNKRRRTNVKLSKTNRTRIWDKWTILQFIVLIDKDEHCIFYPFWMCFFLHQKFRNGIDFDWNNDFYCYSNIIYLALGKTFSFRSLGFGYCWKIDLITFYLFFSHCLRIR